MRHVESHVFSDDEDFDNEIRSRDISRDNRNGGRRNSRSPRSRSPRGSKDTKFE
jgi:hypothetical protein